MSSTNQNQRQHGNRSAADVVVIGAGAAGLFAAARAAELGRNVLIVEKNRKAGVKILMSGGTRCNLTHAVDRRGIVDAFGKQGRFLYSPLAALGPEQLIELFESEGVATKVESTGKVFPASDKALDVLQALLRRVKRCGATLQLEQAVTDVQRTDAGFEVITDQGTISAAKVIVTTGGKSYPGCGTTGDGYGWLERMGHTIRQPRPALTPVKTRADWAKSLKGVTIPDVAVGIVDGATRVADFHRGSLLFAHFGLSGPVVLDLSRYITGHARPRSLELSCDFLPGTAANTLADQMQSNASGQGKKQLAVLLSETLPRRLADSLVELAGVPADRRVAELSRQERGRLVQTLKEARIPITGTMGFEKAEVTAGGVSLDEIDSRTMQSKLVPGLYVAGEILDLDGPIGGYNFQAAFSTGWLAGQSCASD